jgi:hypothetical protein
MTIRFDRVPYGNSQAKEFLNEAAKRTPGEKNSLDEILNGGDVYLISDAEPIGATYIEYSDIGYGEMLNIVLLASKPGTKNLWRDEYKKFIRDLMADRNIRYLCVIGRNGWDSIFPELKSVGTIYIADVFP